jgi:hypothetical protein
MMLAEEVEGLLAKRQAFCHGHDKDFEHILAKISPEELYISCINTLKDKFERSHHKELIHIRDFLNFIHCEVRFLKRENLWPSSPSSIGEIL